MNAPLRMGDFKDDFDPFTALLVLGGEAKITDAVLRAGLAKLRKASGPVVAGDLSEYFGCMPIALTRDYKPYMVLGFDEASRVLSEQDLFSNTMYEPILGQTFGRTLTAMDPPEHTRYRRLFQSAFTPKTINVLKPRFQGVIERLMANFKGRHSADLVSEFAFHFPFEFICDLMNLPKDERLLFHKIALAQTCVVVDVEHGMEASRILADFLNPLIDQRRALDDPEDFMSILANATIDGEALPQIVLVSFFRQLMNAGGETSYHGFTNIMMALLTHSEQLEAVRRDRSLIPQAIEEGLRWNGPLSNVFRTPKRDVVLGGVDIPQGANLQVILVAANYDETRWDDPGRFDIFREPKRHLGFGFGPHICVGQHLAKLELQMALNTLLDRLPNLRIDPSKPGPTIRGLGMRGADALNVIWD